MSFIQQFFTSRDNNANAETFVGQEGRLWWDPISNQIYSSDGVTPGGIPLAGGGGGGNPGGANSQVQFNRNGTFGGSGNLTFNVANGALTAVSFIGDGSQLTNIVTNYSNANVAAYLPTYSGNLAGALLSVSGNVTGNYFIGNGSQLTGIVSSYGDSNVITLLSSFDGHSISTTGNISAGYFIGNGSQLTGIVATSNYSNANVANFLANYGPNTISSTGNITAANVNVANYLSLGTSGAVTSASTGQMFWDVTEQTVSLGMNYGVTQQIGLESYILVRASAPITNGQVVMWTGATGEHVRAAPANMSSAGFRPGYVLGVATQDIALNSDGYITTFGLVHDINTNAYNLGDLLFLDPASTTGGLTATEPTAPNYHIEIGTVTKKSGTGHIQVIIRINDKVSDLSDVTITSPTAGQALIYAGGNIWVNGNPAAANTAGTVTTAAQPNITSVGTLTSVSSTGNISTTGNITGNYFVGNGSQLTGITSSYGNSNVVTLLASFDGNPISTTGNISAGYFVGNGSHLTSINAANVTGTVANATYATSAGAATTAATVTTNAQPNITSVGTLTSLTVSGNVTGGNLLTGAQVSAAGNITSAANIAGTYFIGNGSQLTGITSSYGNSNVVSLLAGFGSNTVSTTGNVTGGNLLSSGIISAAGRTFVASGNATAPGITFSADLAQDTGFYWVGDGNIGVTTNGGIRAQFFDTGFSVFGNITGSNLNATGLSLSGNVVSAINTTANVTTTANITAGYFIGNGSQLTGITSSYGNSNVVANLAALGSNPISTTGNITAGYFVGNGYTLTSVNASNVSGQVANALVAGTVYNNAQPNITSVGTLTSLSSTGNIAGNNLLTAGSASAAGNVTGGNINTGGQVVATGNITGGNLNASGLSLSGNVVSAINTTANITTTGNISAGYFIGNGSQLTGITVSTTYGNANVSAYLASGTDTSNIITTGNVSAGNIIGTRNVTGANVLATGFISTAGRVFAGNGVVNSPGMTFGGDIGQDTGLYLISDGNIGVSTNGVLRASFFDTGFSSVGNITGPNVIGTVSVVGGVVNGTTDTYGGNLRTAGIVNATGNITGGNLNTGAQVVATGNITGGNILTNGLVSASGNITIGGLISASGNIDGGNIRTIGLVSAFGTIRSAGGADATAFAVGNAAVSNVALGFFPNAGIAAEMAIRDYSTVPSTMYFDNSIGNSGQLGQFQFRGGSSYTQWARIDQYGVNQPTRPAFRVYGNTSTNFTTGTTLSNQAIDYNQGSNYVNSTGIFTAPVAGLYSVWLNARAGTTASLSQIGVFKNGNTSGGANTVCFWEITTSATQTTHFGVSSVTKLAAGDTLQAKVVAGGVQFDGNDNWGAAYIG